MVMGVSAVINFPVAIFPYDWYNSSEMYKYSIFAINYPTFQLTLDFI